MRPSSFAPVMLIVAVNCASAAFLPQAVPQDVTVVRRITSSGTVEAINAGKITVLDADGRAQTYKIQDKDEQAMAVGGGELIFRAPATISVIGQFNWRRLQPGMIVRFKTRMTRSGKVEAKLEEIELLLDNVDQLSVRPSAAAQTDADAEVTVVGQVQSVSGDRMTVSVPKSEFAPKAKVVVQLAEDTRLVLRCDHLNYVRAGDLVKKLNAVELSTGDLVGVEIDLELRAGRGVPAPSFADRLDHKYLHLSDQPGRPRRVSSRHFVLHTDISDRSAHVLLEKLETMLNLVSTYFRKNPRQQIHCFVVDDLSSWPAEEFPDIALRQIRAGTAVTVNRALGSDRQSVVYGAADHGVIQHEAIHAYCFYGFGDTGPLWYAEGMAEMARFWRPEDKAVSIDPVIVDYLSKAPRQSVSDILMATEPNQINWRHYAWCWALCYLMASHPDYGDRFKELGIDMMERRGATFESVFGDVAPRIAFEFDQFIQNFGNGYRVDLCAWQWNRRPRMITPSRRVKQQVQSARGWQATGGQVQAGRTYDFVAEGNWKLSPFEEAISADGGSSGRGRLVGAILSGFQLSEPFELGNSGSFVAPTDGELFVRCRDDWTELADNHGSISVEFRAAKPE